MKIHDMFAYLCVNGAAKGIDFYVSTFGAREKFRLTEPSGRIGHAELDFDGTTLMLADEFPEYGIKGPQAFGGSAVTLHLHVENADALIQRPIDARAQPPVASPKSKSRPPSSAAPAREPSARASATGRWRGWQAISHPFTLSKSSPK